MRLNIDLLKYPQSEIEMDYKEARIFYNNLKFGDILLNHWASDKNPTKVMVLISKKNHESIHLSDMNDLEIWFHIKSGLKLQKIGNIFTNPELLKP